MAYRGQPSDHPSSVATRNMERRRLALGLCAKCGVPRGAAKRVCARCAERLREQGIQRRKRLAEKGRCTRCGVRAAKSPNLTCKRCGDAVNVIQSALYEERRAAGRCTRCGEKCDGDYALCSTCLEKDTKWRSQWKKSAKTS